MKQMLEPMTNTFRMFVLLIALLTCANVRASWRVINMQKSGTLSSQFEWKEDWYLDSLTVTGVINSSDLKFIREHSFAYSLNYVDLSKATIEEGYIPGNAFQASQRLTTLLLPETSVDSIGESAFHGCGIRSLVIPNTVKAIAKNAFYGCSIKSVTIPESVKNIGQGAFMSSELTSVVLPNSITTIAECFHGCDSLKSVVLPNGLTTIGEKCFMGCKSLKRISIPETVTTIGEYAFANSGLEFVEIPYSVTSINKSVFRSCPNLRRATLHENMKTIAEGMFADCTSLKSVVIPSSVTEIENLAFDGCTSLKSIVIPNSVTKIETNAFAYCTAMHTFCFPASVNSVNSFYKSGVKAFYVLGSNLLLGSSVALGTADSTLAIYVLETYYKKYKKEESSWDGDKWYVYYDNVQVLSTPINIISCDEMQLEIGDVFQLAAFNVYEHPITWSSSDVSIAEVTQDGLVTVKGSGTVTITASSDIADPVTCVINVVKKQQSITWNQSFNVAHIGDEFSLNAIASSGLSVEYAITQGSDYAEIKDDKLVCKAAGDVTIEARQRGNEEYDAAESVSKIISISEDVTTFPLTIDGLTYDYCDNNNNELQVTGCTAEVANVRSEINGIPVTTMNQTFRGNQTVKEVYLPASIVNIGFIPFEKNYNLTKITVDNNNPVLCDVDGVLFSKDKSTLLYYPAGKGTTYSVPIGTTAISDHAFSGDEQLEGIELPEGLESIASDAFQSCIGLTSFTFPSTINQLNYGVIRECKNITEIHCAAISPANISMGGNVFENIDKETCTLYVPIGTKALYEAADQWKDFKNIVEESATGMVHISMNDITLVVHGNVVEIINAPNGCQIQIHSMTGQLVYAGNKAIVEIPNCGMYIITVCGQSRKIIIK